MRDSIMCVFPRGEAIRTHCYSGVTAELRKVADVHVVSVVPNAEVYARLAEDATTIRPLTETASHRRVRLAREALETAHNQYLASEAAAERRRRRDLEAAGDWAAMLRNVAKRALARPFSNSRGLAVLDRLHENLALRLDPIGVWNDALERTSPDVVFNTSHVHSRNAEGLVLAARHQGRRTASFLFSWDNLTSQGRIVPQYDLYLGWNATIKDDLLRIYPHIDPETVVVTGTPQFDFHFWPELRWSRERLSETIGADVERDLIL